MKNKNEKKQSEWLKRALELEKGCDVSAGREDFLLRPAAAQTDGIQQLLAEFRKSQAEVEKLTKRVAVLETQIPRSIFVTDTRELTRRTGCAPVSLARLNLN